jgi:hypothetical protein
MFFNLQAPIAVICNDAGATNNIVSLLRIDGRLDAVRPVMYGPAERLWRNAFPSLPLCQTIEIALQDAKSLISGTGWASNIEHEARQIARARGIRSVAVLDHWVNYEERFIRKGECIWPDEFWVLDKHAKFLAEKTFPGVGVRQLPNFYLMSQVKQVSKIPLKGPELLYVLEPLRTDWGRGEEGEFQALDFFVAMLPRLNLPSDIVIRLRLHPSEAATKYEDWIARQSLLQIIVDDSPQFSDALSLAGWVAGCESFGLVIALEAGRQVFCTLPPWAPACRLPYDGLMHLKMIV